MHISCNNPHPSIPGHILHLRPTALYLHDAERLGLLHLAEDQSKHQVQVLPELLPHLGDDNRHQPSHKWGCVLRSLGVQQFGNHLHDVIQPIVTWNKHSQAYINDKQAKPIHTEETKYHWSMNMAFSCFVRRVFFDFRTRILPSLKVSELHVFSLLSVNCVPYITFVSPQINFVFNMQKIQSLEKFLKILNHLKYTH